MLREEGNKMEGKREEGREGKSRCIVYFLFPLPFHLFPLGRGEGLWYNK
jgi:hypothetical protein